MVESGHCGEVRAEPEALTFRSSGSCEVSIGPCRLAELGRAQER